MVTRGQQAPPASISLLNYEPHLPGVGVDLNKHQPQPTSKPPGFLELPTALYRENRDIGLQS